MMGKRALLETDETMSLSSAASSSFDNDDSAVVVVAGETTRLVARTCAADPAAVHHHQHQHPLLFLPLHGDAARAAAETAAAAAAVAASHNVENDNDDDDDDDMHHHCSSSEENNKSFLQVFIHSKGPPQIAVMCILLAFGFGSTVGVVPAVMSDRYARLNYGYTGQLECSAYNNNNNNNNNDSLDSMIKPQACLDGSAHAQNAVAMEQFIANTCSFLTSSMIGSLSDQHGRRHLLLIGLFLSTLSPCCLVLIQLWPQMSPNYYYATSACTSGLVNWVAVALSSLSDVMPRHLRAPSFGLILAAFSLGFAFAPNFAIFLGHWHVSILAMIMIFLGFLVVFCFFPETLSPEVAAQATCMRLEQEAAQQQQQQQQQQEQQESMSTMTTTTSRPSWLLSSSRRLYHKCTWMLIYRPLWELSILNRNRLFRLLSCLAFFNSMAASGDRTLLIYYVQEPDTGIAFDDADIAKMFFLVGILGIFVQGVVLNHANDVLGERRLVMTCFVCGVVHNLFYGMAANGNGSHNDDATTTSSSSLHHHHHHAKAMIFIGAAISSLVGMAFPTISAIKANNVHKCEQGRIQGALYSLQAVASAIGPTSLRFVHHFTKNYGGALLGPGSMFCFASFLYAMAAYCAHLLPPEANSKRASLSSNETAIAQVVVHDEEEQDVPSVETPLL